MVPRTIVAVLQVRMSSSRLPGKAMRQAQGRSILGHVLDRVRQCKAIDGLCIATSTDRTDDAIADFAKTEGAGLHRGSLDDVAGRMFDAATAFNADALVRVNADSPLIDPAIIDHAVDMFRVKTPDLVTNVLRRTFPKGQSVEVIAASALGAARAMMATAADREHVTALFYANPGRFRIIGFEAETPRGEMQLSVDTQADLAHVEAILSRLGKPAWSHGLEAIVAAAAEIEKTAQ